MYIEIDYFPTVHGFYQLLILCLVKYFNLAFNRNCYPGGGLLLWGEGVDFSLNQLDFCCSFVNWKLQPALYFRRLCTETIFTLFVVRMVSYSFRNFQWVKIRLLRNMGHIVMWIKKMYYYIQNERDFICL